MSEPLVSIIIPAYNAEPFIAEAIRSALSQTWARIEVIVQDDGSSDGTLHVARSFSSTSVQVLAGDHGGVSCAANRGFALAQGDLIKFFDADDVLAPDFVERQVTRLQGETDAVASATYRCFYQSPAEAELPSEVISADLRGLEWLVLALASDSMLSPPQWLIPRPLLARSGLWDERLSCDADYEFMARVALQANEVRFTPGATYYYRSGRRGSLSQQRTREAVESAALSVTLLTEHLLGAEDTASMCRLCANLLQGFVYAHYPEQPDLTSRIAIMVRDLGGSDLVPTGSPGFQALRPLIGWRLSRRLENWAVRHRLNRAALSCRIASRSQPFLDRSRWKCERLPL